MSDTKVIERTTKICLKPYELGDIHGAISSHLETLVHTSIAEGYILSIPTICNYTKNIIHSTTACCLIDVTYKVELIQPVVGETYTCMVNILFKEGIFVKLYEINILIRGDSLLDGGWEYTKQQYTHGTKKPLQKGSWVKVQIKSVRHEDNVYQCLGLLV